MAIFHIHMGLPKTGSTTFQSTLQLNAEILSREMLIINRMCSGTQRQGLLKAHAYMRNTYKLGIDIEILKRNLEAAFGTCLSDVPDTLPVLVTDEGLCGPHPGQFKDHDGVLPALPAALDALATVFAPDKTVFHIIVRDNADWIKSLYNQAVKQTGYTSDFEEFESSFTEGFGIEAHVKALQSAYTDKDIRVHKMEDHGLFPGEQILADCGMNQAGLETLKIPDKKNQSWSTAMLQAMRVINGADIDKKSKNILRKEIAQQRDTFAKG